ncbi:cytochrome c [Rhizobium sp. PL01]|nr:cytochrome c [Rhizobium sp. PL01]MDW5317641.1 cytochrome c [Rhizobium sp. PL01]
MGMNASAKKLAVLVLPIAVFATAISIATAQTAAPGNVVQRQDGMKAMANAAKSINAMFKDTSPYDARAFKAAAETIRVHSGATLSALFDGSGTTAVSKASPSIETDRQQFDKLANDLGIYASALSVAADRNPDTLGPGMRMQTGDAMGGGPFARKVDAARDAASMPAEHAFHMMLQTCTSCHAKFRVKTD